MKKIIFMGTPQFAAEILQGLLEHASYQVIAVVTQPDRPVGRKRVLTQSPVKQLALAHDIPLYQPERISRSEELEELINLDADIIVTAAYGQFIPTRLINSTPHTAINVHASLLPKYRGAAPIHYAIWKGDHETGISIIYMTKEMDAGDILAQRSCVIESDETVGALFGKLAIIGRELLLDTLFKLFANEITAVQQDVSQVVFSPSITKEQEQLNWYESAHQVDCHVRAFNPFPSTYTVLGDLRIKVWAGAPMDYEPSPEDLAAEPGTILAYKRKHLIVKCGHHSYYGIREWQESGKKRLSLEDYFKGNDLAQLAGQVFASVQVEDEATHES